MRHLLPHPINEGKRKFPNIKRMEVGGFAVLQGRDAESNDHLTLELADDEDYWFHAKGVPGSHVVIKADGKVPDRGVIYSVAEIAARNCQKKEGMVEVVYCKKKFVTKRPGMNPGQVAVDEANSEKIEVQI
jgi:predicted ribosome quality control (RQC) complex YloA/Tae2 family protein